MDKAFAGSAGRLKPCCEGHARAVPIRTPSARLLQPSCLLPSQATRRQTVLRRNGATDSPLLPGLSALRPQRQNCQRRQRLQQVVARAPAADAVGNRGPPGFLVRMASAISYLIPWISIESMGQEIYRRLPATLILYGIPGPFISIYYSSQFAPLIIFFLLYLSVVKNNKLHHFVRYNCMQAIQLDITAMLFHLLRTYFPAELRWSWVIDVWDMASWSVCMCTILYCVVFALWGKYADIPYVSESVYLQVDSSM